MGICPRAPGGPAYRHHDFEALDVPIPVDALLASRSLHHAADLDEVEADEQAAIDARPVEATCIQYAAIRP